MRCPNCNGVLPGGGCSTCRPMPVSVGRISFSPQPKVHVCEKCFRGLPCGDTSSLSAVVGLIAERRTQTDAEWKREVFTPTPEVM